MKQLIAASFMLAAASCALALPKVVAHRGCHLTPDATENSIRSLVKSDSVGAYACEFDVWLSADGMPYVHHNDATREGVVLETATSDVLDSCTLPNGEKLPRLADFLDAAKGLSTGLVLELKPHKDSAREDIAVPLILDMVRQRGLDDRMMYISFSRNACEKFIAQTARPVQFLHTTEPDEVKKAGAAGADFLFYVLRDEHPEWIDSLHNLGLEVNVWTVNKPEDIQWAIDSGVDYITTNEPVLCGELIEKASLK